MLDNTRRFSRFVILALLGIGALAFYAWQTVMEETPMWVRFGRPAPRFDDREHAIEEVLDVNKTFVLSRPNDNKTLTLIEGTELHARIASLRDGHFRTAHAHWNKLQRMKENPQYFVSQNNDVVLKIYPVCFADVRRSDGSSEMCEFRNELSNAIRDGLRSLGI